MIAVPVKTNKENAPVSTLFGKSKWFAFIDKNGVVSIEPNKVEGGRKVVESLVSKGVNTLVFHNMGANPFISLQKKGIDCFHNGGKRILLNDLIAQLKNGTLTKVDDRNMFLFVEQGKMHKKATKHNHLHN